MRLAKRTGRMAFGPKAESAGVMSKVKMHVEEQVRTHLRRRHKLSNRAPAYNRFPGLLIYGRYGLFKLPTKAPWKSAHAKV